MTPRKTAAEQYAPISREAFGARLRKARVAAGWPTLVSASEAVGMNPIQLGTLERGSKTPRFETLHRLVVVLGLDLASLFAPCDPAEVAQDDKIAG